MFCISTFFFYLSATLAFLYLGILFWKIQYDMFSKLLERHECKKKKRKPLYFILNIWHFCFIFIMIKNGSSLFKIKKKKLTKFIKIARKLLFIPTCFDKFTKGLQCAECFGEYRWEFYVVFHIAYYFII